MKRRHTFWAHGFLFAVLALTVAASAADAQGRGRKGGSEDGAPPRPTVAPTLWEPEQIFGLAVSHATDLKLTDQQRSQIDLIASKLRATNAPILESIDTLRPPTPPPVDPNAPQVTPPPPTQEEIAAVVARRHALGEARAQVHENIRLARDQMNQLLSPEQQTRLAALENSARTSAERGDPGGSTPTPGSLTPSRGRRPGQGPPY